MGGQHREHTEEFGALFAVAVSGKRAVVTLGFFAHLIPAFIETKLVMKNQEIY